MSERGCHTQRGCKLAEQGEAQPMQFPSTHILLYRKPTVLWVSLKRYVMCWVGRGMHWTKTGFGTGTYRGHVKTAICLDVGYHSQLVCRPVIGINCHIWYIKEDPGTQMSPDPDPSNNNTVSREAIRQTSDDQILSHDIVCNHYRLHECVCRNSVNGKSLVDDDATQILSNSPAFVRCGSAITVKPSTLLSSFCIRFFFLPAPLLAALLMDAVLAAAAADDLVDCWVCLCCCCSWRSAACWRASSGFSAGAGPHKPS